MHTRICKCSIRVIIGLLLTKSNFQRKHEMHNNNQRHDGYTGCDMPERVCVSVYKKRSLFVSKIIYMTVVYLVITRWCLRLSWPRVTRSRSSGTLRPPFSWTKGRSVTEEVSVVIIIFVQKRVHPLTLEIYAKYQNCPKRCYIFISLYGVTSKRTVILTVSAMPILYRA
jgi:hypothetical protein